MARLPPPSYRAPERLANNPRLRQAVAGKLRLLDGYRIRIAPELAPVGIKRMIVKNKLHVAAQTSQSKGIG